MKHPHHPQLVSAIDVSTAQPTDLTDLITRLGTQHVVVKLYQSVEVAGGRDHAKAQIASAQANGCSIGGYVWLYASLDPASQVTDALSLAREAGVTLPILWIDVEPYEDGTCPQPQQILDALQAAADAGQLAGLYTGQWVWDRLGDPEGFADTILWVANYDGNPSLSVGGFGGMRIKGHQWTDVPVDCSVFDPSVVG